MLYPDTLWKTAPLNPSLSYPEVHIWRASLNLTTEQIKKLEILLSQPEQEKAHKFVFDKDRNQFLVARGLLRIILGRYLGVEPAQLEFSYNSHGKPQLLSDFVGELEFNLSHSHGVALYAVGYGRRLGIDLEYIRPAVDYKALAQRFFSAAESARLLALPAPLQQAAFFSLWTLKEAFIKATGAGLALPLDGFEVSLDAEQAALLKVYADPAETARWSMLNLKVDPAFKAALVVEGHGWEPRFWQIEDTYTHVIPSLPIKGFAE